MTTIELKYYEGNKQTTEEVKVIGMNIFQISRVTKEINALLKDINANEHLRNAINDYIQSSKANDEYNRELINKAHAENREIFEAELLSGVDTLKGTSANFVQNLLGSFEILLENAPERLINLLSIASGIRVEILSEQDPYTFLDVFDAVVEANDIPKLVERLKKSKHSLKTLVEAVAPKTDEQTK